MIVALVLDTNALSASAEGVASARKVLAEVAQVAISVIVLGEYYFGIAQSRHRQEYERWLKEMMSAGRVLDLTDETAIWYAQVRNNSERLAHQSLPTTPGSRRCAASIPFPY